jgi:DDE superfamily endonuclease
VWAPFCADKPPTYLLMDECAVHMIEVVKNALSDCRTGVNFIVKGYTTNLQVLDVGINKPFKGYVRETCGQFMVNNNGRKTTQLDVAKWIATAWERIKSELITNTWKSISIE